MKPPVSDSIMYIFLKAEERKQGIAKGGSAEWYHRASLKRVTQ